MRPRPERVTERPASPPPLPGASDGKGWADTPGHGAAIDRKIAQLEGRSIRDAECISDLYERIAWLGLPWWRRAFRRPPWLAH